VKTTDVDVVVVNFHTPGDLEYFVRSIKDEQFASITIANNSPTQADRITSTRLGGEVELTIIDHQQNLGYARAVNHAAAELTAPILAIFNADVVVEPGSIQKMIDFMDAHPEVGIAGPKQVDDKNRITHGGIIGTNRRPRHRAWHARDHAQCNDILTDVVSVSGSAYFVRRECWDELTDCHTYQESCLAHTGHRATGAFLPTQHYYEETFCSVHARAHGWKVAYNGKAKMVHLWHRSSPLGRTGAEQHLEASRTFYRKACDDHGISRE
jgi:GT2 family glycosyltransferase